MQTTPANASTYIYVVVLIVAILFLALLIVFVLYRRANKRLLLSQNEVKQFHSGVGVDEDGLPLVSMEHVDAVIKFPKSYEIAEKHIEMKELIGSGQFGLVHKGILCERQQVAVKIPREDCGKDQFMSALSELKILCHVGAHENVVSFLGAYTKKISVGKLLIVTEFCAKGSLLAYLKELRVTKPEDIATSAVDFYQLNMFAYQIAVGMEYVASKRIIHGDLATRNILMTSDLTCKVADFGLSRRLYELGEYQKTSKEPLPWKWMAPESLTDMVFSTKSDIWSYGVTLWEIFSFGKTPYPGMSWTDNFAQELEAGLRMGKAQFASDEIKMLDCWNFDPHGRPSFTDLKEYFAGIMSAEYISLCDN